MRAGVQWRGRWSSEHKDEELIARVSLNVSHWLFQLRQPNRGGLDHAFGMRPKAGCAALCCVRMQWETFSTWVGFTRLQLLLSPQGFLYSCLVPAVLGKQNSLTQEKENTLFQFLIFFVGLSLKNKLKKLNWIFQLDHVLEWLNKLIPTFIQDHRWTQDGQEMQKT